MKDRKLKARWHLEHFDPNTRQWVTSNRSVVGTWEDAVTACSKMTRIQPWRLRVCPIAVPTKRKSDNE